MLMVMSGSVYTESYTALGAASGSPMSCSPVKVPRHTMAPRSAVKPW
jgi:hypothetical protein